MVIVMKKSAVIRSMSHAILMNNALSKSLVSSLADALDIVKIYNSVS